MLDDLMRELAAGVATEMPLVYAEQSRKNVSEQYHLQPATTRVSGRLAPYWEPAPTLAGKKFGDALGWVGLGHVDTVFHWPDGTKTFLELKCGLDLSACVWDAVKLSAALAGGNASSAYLLAGTSNVMWKKPTPGAELFQTTAWRTHGAEIRDAYSRWWRFWQSEPHIPGRVRKLALEGPPAELVGLEPFTAPDAAGVGI